MHLNSAKGQEARCGTNVRGCFLWFSFWFYMFSVKELHAFISRLAFLLTEVGTRDSCPHSPVLRGILVPCRSERAPDGGGRGWESSPSKPPCLGDVLTGHPQALQVPDLAALSLSPTGARDSAPRSPRPPTPFSPAHLVTRRWPRGRHVTQKLRRPRGGRRAALRGGEAAAGLPRAAGLRRGLAPGAWRAASGAGAGSRAGAGS